MAVYTHLSKEQIDAFLSEYMIGELASFAPIQEGIENTNYILETSQGKYILTLFENRVNESDIPFYLAFKHHLAEKKIACPDPLKRKDGSMCATLAGKPAVIVSFLQGKGVTDIKAYHTHALGEYVAKLHLAAQDFPQTRKNELSLQGWHDLFQMIKGKMDKEWPGLESLIEQELQFVSDHWPTDIPSGIVHADLFPDNVFFIGEELTGVIDFYFSCHDSWMYDWAICMNAWCFDKQDQFNSDLASELFKSYHNQRPITQKEIEALPILLRGAAIRFLLTRVYDWINQVPGALVTVKDPQEYINKLRFHQQHNITDILAQLVIPVD